MTAWERAKPLIEAALEYDSNGHTIEDVERSIAEGRSVLLSGENSAIVFDVSDVRLLHVRLAGGTLGDLRVAGIQQVEDLAKEYRCDSVVVSGRSGWARVLRERGYQMVLVKDIKDG